MTVQLDLDNVKQLALELVMGLRVWAEFPEDNVEGFIIAAVYVSPNVKSLSNEDVQKIADDETSKLTNRPAVQAILKAHLELIS